MAKVKSLIGITGSLNGLTFYTLNGQPIVRRKGGGFTSKGVKKGANYVRTRENASEFGHCSAMSKRFRIAIQALLGKKEFDGMHQHLVKVLFAVKNLDTVSDRGQRNLAQGIQHPQAADLLHEFSFNPHCSLSQLLLAPYSLAAGVFKIEDFKPSEAFKFPKGATQVSLIFGACRFDFETGDGILVLSETINIEKNGALKNLEIPVTPPDGNGTLFFVLKISFYQEVSGVRYLFKNKEFGVVASFTA